MKTAVCDRCSQLFNYDPEEYNDRMFDLRIRSWQVPTNPEKKPRSKSTEFFLCKKCYTELRWFISRKENEHNEIS